MRTSLKIATGHVGQTVAVCDRVAVTVFDVQPGKACLGVTTPLDMSVSSTPARKLLEAVDGTKMGALRVGDSLEIGGEITVLVLTTQNGKVRFGMSTAPSGKVSGKCAQKPIHGSRRGFRVIKRDSHGRGRRRRGAPIQDVF